MLSVFLEMVKRVGIFIIIGQTILHLGIGKEYEKYMKLVISFMVAAQIVFAFGVCFNSQGAEVWKWEEEYYENWNRNMKALEEEFQKTQGAVNTKLQQRFEKQKEMLCEEDTGNGTGIKIKKIVVQ